MRGDVGRLVLTHKDRLLRFGSELVFAMCEEFETEVVIINKSSEELSFEQELVTDAQRTYHGVLCASLRFTLQKKQETYRRYDPSS